MTQNTLTLVLDGEIDLKDYRRAIQHFGLMVDRLSKEFGGDQPIHWGVQDLQSSSAIVTAQGFSPDTEAIEKVIEEYTELGRELRTDGPYKYSRNVLMPAIRLRNVLNGNITSMRFETAQDEVFIYAKPSTSVDIALESPEVLSSRQVSRSQPARTLGVIEGRIQTLSSRGGLRFTLFDSLHDKAVSCYLPDGKEDMVRDLWGRRADVQGLISRDPVSGRPVSIREIQDITPLPEIERGSYRNARGAIPWNPESPPAADTIRKLRDMV